MAPFPPSAERSIWTLGVLLALIYLLTHAPFAATTPDDLRSVALTQASADGDPHHGSSPTAQPLLVATTRMVESVSRSSRDARPTARYAHALALVGAAGGALATLAMTVLFGVLASQRGVARTAAVLAVACPVFWYTGVRPTSELPGLALATGAQALGLSGLLACLARPADDRVPGAIVARMVAAAVLAGLAPGMSPAMSWVATPVVVALAGTLAWRRQHALAASVVLAAAIGVELWAVPLVLVPGLAREYAWALAVPADRDFGDVATLASDFGVTRFVRSLADTLVRPWADWRLAAVVLAAALVGAAQSLYRRSRAALWLCAVTLPYLAFHLAAHDARRAADALPLGAAVALFAATGLHAILGRFTPLATATVATLGLVSGAVPAALHADESSPTFQAIDAVERRLACTTERPVFAMHHAVDRALRGESLRGPRLPSTLAAERLELARYWESGGAAPVWFLADARRSDLALVDPSSVRELGVFDAPLGPASLAASQPPGVRWYEITHPNWVALRGWALTPEVFSQTLQERRTEDASTASAIVRRHDRGAWLVLGGRNLRVPQGADAVVSVRVDDREITRFAAPLGQPFFHMIDLPAGTLAGPGEWTRLEVKATGAAGHALVDVWFDQFDLQPDDRVIAGLEAGWFEPEGDGRSATRWRWMADRGVVRVHSAGRDVRMRIEGEGPLRYLPRSSRLKVVAGNAVIAEHEVGHDFALDVVVPAAAIAAGDGRIVLAVDQAFVPSTVLDNGDDRRLGLRIHGVRVEGLHFPAGKATAVVTDASGPQTPGPHGTTAPAPRPGAAGQTDSGRPAPRPASENDDSPGSSSGTDGSAS